MSLFKFCNRLVEEERDGDAALHAFVIINREQYI